MLSDTNISADQPLPQESYIKSGFLRQYSAFLVRVGYLIDGLIIFLSLIAAVQLVGDSWKPAHLTLGLMGVLFFEMIASFFELYRSSRMVRLRYEILKIFIYWSCAIGALATVLFSLQNHIEMEPRTVIVWFLLAFFFICISHCAVRLFMRYARAFGYDSRRVAFIGANETALKLQTVFDKNPWMGMTSVGYFDCRQQTAADRIQISSKNLAGNTDDLVALASQCKVDAIYICLPLAAEKRIKHLIDRFSDTTASVYFCPSFSSFNIIDGRWDDIMGQPVVSVVESPFVGHQRYLKRLEDLAIVFLLTPVLIPVMAIIAILIKLDSSGPVFFTQNRYGVNGNTFKMFKFRSMYAQECKSPFVQASKNDSRITRIGSYLRKTSLDELPQFINVFLGDMSVVGPRPHPDIVNEDLRKRIYRYMLRHKIKPGITGLAQVNGFRGETPTLDKMERRIEQDLQYIRQWSPLLDLKILIKTLGAVSGENVY